MRVMKRNHMEKNEQPKGKPLSVVFSELDDKSRKDTEDIIIKSLIFAMEAHRGQTREYSRIPYHFHLFDVTKRASEYMDLLSISNGEFMAACALHDTVEDTKVTYDELVQKFGKRVADIVMEVSRPKSGDNNFEQKYRYLKSFYTKSREAVVLKIADRVCNTKDYMNNPETAWYAIRYALQAYPVYRSYVQFENLSPKVLSDIAWVENLIRMRYNVSIFMSDEKDIELSLGIGVNQK